PWSELAADLRYAARSLRRAPVLAATASLVLALGIAANTTLFTVVNALLLRPLPVSEPSGLVDVWPDIPGGNSFLSISWGDYLRYRESDRVESLAAFTGVRATLGDESGPDIVVQLVSPEYFGLLGLTPTLGRLEMPSPVVFGDAPTAVLTHALWQESFGADPSVVGREVRISDTQVTVVGVGPEGFEGHFIGFPSDLWVSISAAETFLPGFDPSDPASKPFELIGRLAPGATVETARAALRGIGEELERASPTTNRGHRVGVTQTTGLDHSLHAGVVVFASLLTGVSLLVLLIACLNVGSILLVRALSREREMSLRVALGAGVGRIVRTMASEALVLTAIGTAIGVTLALRINTTLSQALPRVSNGLRLDLGIDWRVLVLSAGAAVIAAGAASITPSLHVLRQSPAHALRSRGEARRGVERLRAVLVVAQVAVSVTLVVATGLFARALAAGGELDPGFAADDTWTVAIDLTDQESPDRTATVRALLDQLGTVGATEAVAANAPPIGVARTPLDIEVPGVPLPPDADTHIVDARTVSAGYFAALSIPVLAGRDFASGDEDEPLVIASRAMADRFWPAEAAVGRTVRVDGSEARVVGVVQDTRYLVQDEVPDPILYRVMSTPPGIVRVTVRTSNANLEEVVELVRRVVPGQRRVEPTLSREILDDALLPQRVGTVLIGAMGLAALLLAALGVYGLVQYSVARSRHELGVRLALGGGTADVLRVVLAKGARWVGLGLVVGVVVARSTAPALSPFLGEVGPGDPLTYLTVAVTFALVAVLASGVPARSALKVHPTEALRGD
ncbi:MAG: ADOP family duplicated permease, partial [Gemmatimonadota bacterium]